jgi:hypothetical protein
MGWVELIRDGKVIHTWPLDPANRDTLRLAATLQRGSGGASPSRRRHTKPSG